MTSFIIYFLLMIGGGIVIHIPLLIIVPIIATLEEKTIKQKTDTIFYIFGAILWGIIEFSNLIFIYSIGSLFSFGIPPTKANILIGVDFSAFMLFYFYFLLFMAGIFAEALHRNWADINITFEIALTISIILIILIHPFLFMYIADWITGSYNNYSVLDTIFPRSQIFNPSITPLRFTFLWSKITESIRVLNLSQPFSEIISVLLVLGGIAGGVKVVLGFIKNLIGLVKRLFS